MLGRRLHKEIENLCVCGGEIQMLRFFIRFHEAMHFLYGVKQSRFIYV